MCRSDTRGQGGLRKCGYICPLAHFQFLMDGFLLSELPSPHPNLLTQRSPTGHLRTSSATALKLFPTQKESSVPSDFWQFWKSRSSGLSLMAGLCFAFWKEFTFCPKLRTQPWKTFLDWWSFRHQSPDRDFSGRNKRISPEPAVLWPLLCAAHTGSSSWRHLALTPKEVTKCPTPWLLAYLKIKMGLQGPGIHTLCHKSLLHSLELQLQAARARCQAPSSSLWPLFFHSWLSTLGLPGPHRPTTLLPNLLPNASTSPPPLQPSWPHLDSRGDQTADASLVLLQVTLARAQEELSKAETRPCPSPSLPAPSVMKYNPNFLQRSSKEPAALASLLSPSVCSDPAASLSVPQILRLIPSSGHSLQVCFHQARPRSLRRCTS